MKMKKNIVNINEEIILVEKWNENEEEEEVKWRRNRKLMKNENDEKY